MTAAAQGYFAPNYVVLCDNTGNPVNVTSNALNTTSSGAISGTVAISQTTPGTTNRVAANLDQVAGASIAQGHGTAATAIRVELPTDGTGVVGLAAGAAVIGSLAANQSVNIAQTNGGAIAVGHGTAATAIRVELPTDGTGVVGLAAGAATIGALTANQSVNQTQWAGTAVDVNNGAVSAGTVRVTIANNSTGVVGLNAGTNVVGQVNLAPQTSGGTTMAHAINPNNVTGVVVKNSAGQLYGVTMVTSGTAAGFLHLYNSSSAPTAGSGTIVKTLICPGPSAGGGGASYQWPNGIAFSAGIAYTFTSGISDTDSGQPTQTTFSIDIDYK